MGFRFSVFAFVVSVVIAVPAFSSPRGDLDISYGKLPLSFVENRGQVDDRAKFVIRGPRGSAFFANDGVVFDLRGKSPDEFEKELFPLYAEAVVSGHPCPDRTPDRGFRTSASRNNVNQFRAGIR